MDFSTHNDPWYGMGENIAKCKTIKELLKVAKLDWKVERRTMQLEGKDVPGFAALTRSSDGKVLDVVGSRYVPTQNAQALEFFKEFVEAGKATMETAGSLKGGKLVWGLARLNTSFQLRDRDVVNGYLLCACPHEQGKSLWFKTMMSRPACKNTFASMLRGAVTGWRMGHRTAFDGVKIDEAKDALELARNKVGEFEKNARLLQKLNLSQKEAIKILSSIYQPEHDGSEDGLSPRMKRLIDIYENAPGAQPGNGWGVFNAVTYYADHVASRTPDKRLTNAWVGRTANQKEKVLELLLARV